MNIMQTSRLYIREMTESDFSDLCKMLCDDEVMYAYNGAFSLDEAKEWLNRQIWRYSEYKFGLWAVILKETGEMIGQCGLTVQNWRDKEVLEIGYIFNKNFWRKGYAIEAARACKDYAFDALNVDEVYSIIRDTNTSSQKVAFSNGMVAVDVLIKHYKGVDMPHIVFRVKRKK